MVDKLPQVSVPEKVDDNTVLDYTRQVRLHVTSDLTREGTPDDPKDRAALLAALDSLDRQALTRIKIVADVKTADNDRQASLIVAEVLARTGNKNPFEIDVTPTEVRTVAPDLSRLPPSNSVPGNMDQGISDLNYDSFMGVKSDESEDNDE